MQWHLTLELEAMKIQDGYIKESEKRGREVGKPHEETSFCCLHRFKKSILVCL